jgi:regulator of protease activity HflC (stomatin/prohibitin superfamily)
MDAIKFAFTALGVLLFAGVVLPAMISAKSTGLVLGGIFLMFLMGFILFAAAKAWLMKKGPNPFPMLALVFGLGAMTQGCMSYEKVPAGHVGVKVYLLGGDKGVDNETLGVGRYFIGMNEELFLFPTYTVNYSWTANAQEGSENDESISFQDKDGLVISGDFGIAYAVEATQVSLLFQKYRKGIGEITDIVLRNAVRDALIRRSSMLTAEELYSVKKDELVKNVENDVRFEFKQYGIRIDKISILKSFTLPPEVVKSINDKIQATQKAQMAQNQVLEATAEADKIIEAAKGAAESTRLNADAQAYANQKISQSLTQNLVDYYRIQKWNGANSQVVSGSGGGVLVNLK